MYAALTLRECSPALICDSPGSACAPLPYDDAASPAPTSYVSRRYSAPNAIFNAAGRMPVATSRATSTLAPAWLFL